jgi:hypothetical protein
LLDWKIGSFCAVENLGDISGDAAIHRELIDSIGHQSAGVDVGSKDEHGWQAVGSRCFGDLGAVFAEIGAGKHEDRLRAALRPRPERRHENARGTAYSPRFNKSGSLAMFDATRLASSIVICFASMASASVERP